MPPSPSRAARPVAAALLALVVCACRPADREAAPARPAAPAPPPPAAEQRRARPAPGAFRVAYPRVEDPTYALWRNDFRRARFLEQLADYLNAWVGLPRDVTLQMDACGEANAFYDEETRSVILCYELVEELDGAFAAEPDPAQAVDDALVFTTLHEVGHALVHVLDLPVTGREEDAVDQLAAVMLIDGGEDGGQAAVTGVQGLAGEDHELDDLALAGEHALASQRVYSVLCLVYGSNPDGYADWVGDVLPAERADRCPVEYERAAGSWDRLLEPYRKP